MMVRLLYLNQCVFLFLPASGQWKLLPTKETITVQTGYAIGQDLSAAMAGRIRARLAERDSPRVLVLAIVPFPAVSTIPLFHCPYFESRFWCQSLCP